MEIQAGQVAKSLRGHDKDELFVIIKTEENYAYIVDGKLRMLDDPKKKKIKHLDITNYVCCDLKEKIINAERVSNSDIREALEIYKNLKSKGE